MKYLRQSVLMLFSTVFLVSCFNNKDRIKGEISNQNETPTKGKKYWPNGAQLVISVSMQFETGGQPEGAESPFSSTSLPAGQPDLPAESWYRYGGNEGIYRMLDLWKKYNIKVTSHIVGTAAEKYPEVAKAIANEGHEVAAHGFTWDNQWNKSHADELYFVKEGVDVVQKITGKRAVGYNSNWLRRSPNTLKVLQELGFLYHIDDVSHDEPFITKVQGKNFMVIPYTIRNNDIVNIEGKHWSPDQFLTQLKFEFDRLYEEGASKRRMMSISFHDRIGGTPAMIHAMEEFIKYTQKKQGVVFMRKDDIAKMVINDPNTPVDNSEEKYNK
ncbi:polysaccharide deacetylase family protein [Chryseobacterium sp. YR221]|uniref:polysaccharide deacetylase family protein n=1 Tax=Chryseobacterium sp. YR221 TaxID=1500293 RepID=UPI0009D81AAD|nr:polysaccharide deacetylase family protein [Chryseobacterium sp. YR221]SMC35214.1 Polysaccharide deacetylase [Chryseobacterium sp. YR221]